MADATRQRTVADNAQDWVGRLNREIEAARAVSLTVTMGVHPVTGVPEEKVIQANYDPTHDAEEQGAAVGRVRAMAAEVVRLREIAREEGLIVNLRMTSDGLYDSSIEARF